jgi:hypothetical protein
MTDSTDGINVRSPHYYVAQTKTRCPNCGRPTEVVALALPSGHETLDAESDTGGEWQPGAGHAILFYVAGLNEPVQQQLRRLQSRYGLTTNPATQDAFWSNHCENCESLLDDYELHCEPGGFSPSNEAEAAKIQLLRVDEALEAAAAGYAFAPEFFELMRRR